MKRVLCVACLLVCTSVLQPHVSMAEHRPVFDIPRLDGITIDGNYGDWGDGGFRVDIMGSPDGATLPPDEFEPSFRMGWDDDGLLLLINVTAIAFDEFNRDDQLYNGACVELFLAPAVGASDLLQIVIAPGMSEEHPEVRCWVNDRRRNEALKEVAPALATARTRITNGYQLEVRLNWESLGIAPAQGVEIGFQIFAVHKKPNGSLFHAVWYPQTGTHSNTDAMHRVRLSDTPTHPVRTVTRVHCDNREQGILTVIAVSTLAGSEVTVGAPDGPTIGRFSQDTPRPVLSTDFPLPLFGRPNLMPMLYADGKPLGVSNWHLPYAAPAPALTALMERQGVKPYDLFKRQDGLKTMRVIFRDRSYNTPVWMLDFSPTADHSDTASVWSPWNPDGSTLYIGGARHYADGEHRGWFFDDEFSILRPAPDEDGWGASRPAVWSPDDPDVYYGPINPSDRVIRSSWRTGKRETVAQWERMTWRQSAQRVYGLTSDGKYIFLDTPNRGIWVPFEHRADAPIPRLRMYDGRPIFPDGNIQGSENRLPVIYGHERYGDMIGLRTGMLINRETGEMTNIAAPLCGNVNYLRAFYEGRVKYPQGEEWDAYGLSSFKDDVRLPEGLTMEELRALWLNLPHATHGHESMSPDREYIAVDAGSLIQRVRDGATLPFTVTTNGENYHLHWQRHPRFFVSWVRGWRMSYGSVSGREFTPVNNANIEFQVFCDTTVQPIVNTWHRFNAYYQGGDFSMLSPDATKIHYGSSMTGRFRNYIAVMARPRPPSNVSWEPDGAAVILSWQPSAYSREVCGYLVYRGDRSGGPYSLMTAEPVDATTWRDTNITPGPQYYYVVTALEHSGLESGYSAEAARAGVGLPEALDAPLVIYAEAEAALFDLPTGMRPGLSAGVDRYAASDWYYIYRHPDEPEGEITLNVPVAVGGEYFLWARVASDCSQENRWSIKVGGHTYTIAATEPDWTWVRAGEEALSLASGQAQFTLSTSDAAARMDMLCLASDAAFVPAGPRPECRTAPQPVAELSVDNIRERVNRLSWKPSAEPGFSHYQVYASRDTADFETGEKTLIGSPTQPELIDWGLKSGSRYFYAVTVVDRRGNESVPARAEASTPPRLHPPFEKQLVFIEAELHGRFERSDAAGLRATQYALPLEPSVNRVTWRVNIPREGAYYLWLRHLRRGSGSRGDDVRQEIRVLADREHVYTLGGGLTDINTPDTTMTSSHPMTEQLWTWVTPGNANLIPAILPAGEIDLVLENMAPDVRYDVLLITDEPSFVPQDGRLRQR